MTQSKRGRPEAAYEPLEDPAGRGVHQPWAEEGQEGTEGAVESEVGSPSVESAVDAPASVGEQGLLEGSVGGSERRGEHAELSVCVGGDGVHGIEIVGGCIAGSKEIGLGCALLRGAVAKKRGRRGELACERGGHPGVEPEFLLI